MQLNKSFFVGLLLAITLTWSMGASKASAFSLSGLWNSLMGMSVPTNEPVNKPEVKKTGRTVLPSSEGRSFGLGNPPTIVASDPADGSIDARAPIFAPAQITITFDRATSSIILSDFEIISLTPELTPKIASTTEASSTSLILNFDRAIPAGERTAIIYKPTGQKICLGALPGDVNGDGLANTNDALTLIAELGKKDFLTPISLASFDINGDGRFNGADASQLMALLNGRDGGKKWNGQALPPQCP